MNDFLQKIAPTLLSATLGPMAGVALAGLGKVFGIDSATTKDITKAISEGKITPDQLAEIKKLEMQMQADEAERGFKYKELEFKDRDSARVNNVAGGIQGRLFYMSVILLVITLGCEVTVLFNGYPPGIPEIIVGRVLGLMDAVAMMVLAYYYGTSSGSAQKTELLAQAQPVK
jgi:hypothetical protein